VRISARNRLCGKITEIIRGSVNSEAIVQLPGSRRLTAIVTNDSVKELGLTVGAPCCALIKASHVLIAVSD
jgi:molybdate transport system regulatory protein